MKKPLALIILDGYGYNPDEYGNAIAAANTPNMDKYLKTYPNTLISASGMDVGLPEGQMGNSEVGHTNIGAGRIVYQELTRITKSIEDGNFYDNAELNIAMKTAKEQFALHLMGLVSDGGVHSHNTHLYALLEFAKRKDIKKVYCHCFMDGRMYHQPLVKVTFKNLRSKLKILEWGALQQFADDTILWIGKIVGILLSRHMTCSHLAKAKKQQCFKCI